MAESVYKVIELVGTSSESWEKAAAAAIETAAKSLRDLRIAEVLELYLLNNLGVTTQPPCPAIEIAATTTKPAYAG